MKPTCFGLKFIVSGLLWTELGPYFDADPKLPGTLVTIDSPTARNDLSSPHTTYEDGWTGDISIETRGSSSANFPKKQYV